MVRLQINENRRALWSGGKDNVGSKRQRHKVARFVVHNTCRLPVEVNISKLREKRDFAFAPVMVNGHAKNVAFLYKRHMVLISFHDVVNWIKLYVTSNKLFERGRCKCVNV